MFNLKFWLLYILILLLLPNFLDGAANKDSIKTYRLGELVVTGYENITPASIAKSKVDFRTIQDADVQSVANLSMYMPGAVVKTNSRGEALLFVRGAGERQLGLFLDGAMINIPWDNRLDLSLVPTDIIGEIIIGKNSSSVLAGANILGGAVHITSYERAVNGFGGSFRTQFTDGGGMLFSIVNDWRFDNFNYITNLSYFKTDGDLLSRNVSNDVKNQSLGSSLINNTHSERINFYARGEYKPNENTSLGLSYNLISADKGVAPENNLEPADARFWRYSDWMRHLITLNGEQIFSDKVKFRATLWTDFFKQQIDAYSPDFKNINEIQNDEDFTFGNRFALEYQVADGHFLTAVYNSFYSIHEETIDSKPQEDNDLPTDEFSQYTYSGGLEYKIFWQRLNLFAGVTADGNATPKTGIFTDYEGLSYSDYGAFFGAEYILNENITLSANFARRSRFATLREAYSGALGKFTVNPDLKAETGMLTDLGVTFANEWLSLNLTGFANFYDDLIIRIKDPNDPQKRMRVNMAEATVFGADLSFAILQNSPYIIQAYLQFLSSDGKEEGKKVDQLEYKPELSSALVLGYRFNFGLKPQFELEYTGKQFGINAASTADFDELEATALINFRLSYGFVVAKNYVEVFARLNNITDEYALSQIGIPRPGRTFSCGLSFKY